MRCSDVERRDRTCIAALKNSGYEVKMVQEYTELRNAGGSSPAALRQRDAPEKVFALFICHTLRPGNDRACYS